MTTSSPSLPPDALLAQIADYVTVETTFTNEAQTTARLCLMDSLGCGLLALNFPECTKLLGPAVPNAVLLSGSRVIGTDWKLDPVQAAFNLGTMIRWLDYNDTWLAAEWGHPSDNFGGILATADYLSRQRAAAGKPPLFVRDVLAAVIQAYEIQGVLALENAFNRVGLDHVILVRIATTAVVTRMLGGSRQQVLDAVSNAWLDGGALRTYRHWPNTGSRKSWAAGDATRRGVQLALWTMAGEMGYSTALSAKQWGFQDVAMRGKPITLGRPLGSYVMENILFKVSYPAEFHAQTAVEAAVTLHPQVRGRWQDITSIRLETHESAVRIISKTGPLRNPADRDHCLQYMVAIGLWRGTLTAEDYEDAAAADPVIDQLREKMEIVEVSRYSQDYLDPNKRSIANAIQIEFADGSKTERIEVEYPIGHRRRRADAVPMLRDKFQHNAETRFSSERVQRLLELFIDETRLDAMPVHEFVSLFAGTGR